MITGKRSPVLQKASLEIKEICEKYDIGGYIILSSRTHGEYLLHFPQWSKAQVENLPNGDTGIRFQSKAKDEDHSTRDTIHMLQVFQLQGAHVAMGMENLIESLESQLFITGGPKRI